MLSIQITLTSHDMVNLNIVSLKYAISFLFFFFYSQGIILFELFELLPIKVFRFQRNILCFLAVSY